MLEDTLVAEKRGDAKPDWRSYALAAPLVFMSALGLSVLLTLVLRAPATKCW